MSSTCPVDVQYITGHLPKVWVEWRSVVLLAAQTQYELESANAASESKEKARRKQGESKEKETVSITIPINDRNLLRELVRRFGWVGVF